MRYIKVDNDKFIEYNEDNNSTRVIIKSEVERSLQDAREHLAEIADDEKLLEWARENYPLARDSGKIGERITELQGLISKLEDL